MQKVIISEQAARQSMECAGCQCDKEVGLLVCWKCFKAPVNGLKYSGLSFEQWQTTF